MAELAFREDSTRLSLPKDEQALWRQLDHGGSWLGASREGRRVLSTLHLGILGEMTWHMALESETLGSNPVR